MSCEHMCFVAVKARTPAIVLWLDDGWALWISRGELSVHKTLVTDDSARIRAYLEAGWELV